MLKKKHDGQIWSITDTGTVNGHIIILVLEELNNCITIFLTTKAMYVALLL